MEITNKIRQYLEENGITQVSVASRTGIKPRRLSRALANGLELRADEFVLICRALKLDLDYFTAA